MKLPKALIRLPVRFCADTLAAEVRALPADAWVPHPQKFEGNDYVPFITPGGATTNEFAGPMAVTPFLGRCPYVMEAMAALDAVWGRSRLMGLGPGQSVPEHIDINYYWRTHVRVHVPILTNDGVSFTCGGETVFMAPGECWLVDTFQSHEVHNQGDEQRIHLVLDTVGGERLWDAVEAAVQQPDQDSHFLAPGTLAGAPIKVEQLNYPRIMSPWEMRAHFEDLLDMAQPHGALAAVRKRLERMIVGWTAAWTEFGDEAAGIATFRTLILAAQQDLDRIGGHDIQMRNGRPLYGVLQHFVFDNAIESERVRNSKLAAAAGERRIAS